LKEVEMRQRLDGESDAPLVNGADGDDVARPDPTMSLGERIREWVNWFGLTRLVTSAAAVVVVCAGAWFLVRTPPPPSEASLPVANAGTGSSTAPEVTLPGAPVVTGTASTVASSRVVVHVAGAVVLAGVYELRSGSRVDDAVRSAGGMTADAELGRINLAAPLVDGDQIYVPAVGEDVPLLPSGSATAASDSTPSGPVDVNRASAGELELLPGVGPATAAAIVAERDRNGPFSSFEELERVPGIGPSKLAGLVGLVIT
jgi:competence protein ComEA